MLLFRPPCTYQHHVFETMLAAAVSFFFVRSYFAFGSMLAGAAARVRVLVVKMSSIRDHICTPLLLDASALTTKLKAILYNNCNAQLVMLSVFPTALYMFLTLPAIALISMIMRFLL